MTDVDGLAAALLDQLPGAVAVIDVRVEALPVVYVNPALVELRGSTAEAIRAAGLAGLVDGDAARVEALRRAFGVGDTPVLRVALTDPARGAFTAELRFEPLRTGGDAITHYAAYHERVGIVAPRADGEPLTRPPVARDDRLSGLRHIDLFHEFYRRDFAIAQREGRSLAVFVFDIDALGVYNDTFGRLAGDTVIRRVGRALLTGLRRASDLIARVEGGCFVGVAAGMDATQAAAHAATLSTRVRELHLHHPRSPMAKVVTVTAGVAQLVPGPDDTPESLLRAAQRSFDGARAERAHGGMGGEAPADAG